MEILERRLDKEKTKTDFKKVVSFYNLWSYLTESKAGKKVLDFAEIIDGQTILEVACGTGMLFEQIVRQNITGQNIGMDLSPDMLKKANKRLKHIKNADFQILEGDALHMNFQDNTFDIVINNFMVDLLPENTFDKIASEFYRILKSDGTLVISTFAFGEEKINRFWYWLAKKYPDLLTGCRPVSFKEFLIKAGFNIENSIEISQNTFPSEIIKARK